MFNNERKATFHRQRTTTKLILNETNQKLLIKINEKKPTTYLSQEKKRYDKFWFSLRMNDFSN